MTSATSATSEGAQGIFSKITFLKSVHSNEKDEVCHSFLVNIFTKSLHRGGVPIYIQLCSVEHMLNSSLTFFSSKLDSPVIKTLERIRFFSNQNIGEGESNFDD